MAFTHLFLDLDGTLYPNNNGMWDLIADNMERYMHEILGIPLKDVPETRKQYFLEYGTTLRGLMANHEIDPHDFLARVHDIPVSDYLKPDPFLRSLLQAVPQPIWILTNSDTPHATRVLKALELFDLFEGILDITYMDFHNKPDPVVFQRALEAVGSPQPNLCVFVDDVPHNLEGARRQGWTTVLVGDKPHNGEAHIQIIDIYRLNQALEQVADD